MNELNNVYLGRLNPEVVAQFETRIREKMTPDPYQWVHFTNDDTDYYKSLFNNPIIEKMKANQKAITSAPGHGFRVHKDEPGVFCALNVVIQCNPTDWVRWYDEEYINSIASEELIDLVDANGKPVKSRNVHIKKYGALPYIEQLTNQQPGDVYLVNTDKYHSFRAIGYNHRLVIQTKFWHGPTIEELATELKGNIFSDYMI